MIASLISSITANLEGIQVVWAFLILGVALTIVAAFGVLKYRLIMDAANTFRKGTVSARKDKLDKLRKENPAARLDAEERKSVREEVLTLEKDLRREVIRHVIEWSCVAFTSLALAAFAIIILKVI